MVSKTATREKTVTFNLFFFSLLFLISRITYLLFLHPYYYTLGGGEEPYTASVAIELMTGPLFPIFEYLISDYQGGTLVIASVMVPWMKLFGATTFASKLAPLIFFLGALLLWARFAKHHFGNRTAFYFCLLFIFSPPSFTHFSMTALGYHSESIFFTALSVTLFFNILNNQKSLGHYLLFGFSCGFGLWFAYIYGITLAVILLYWLLQDHKFIFKRNFGIYLIGFLVGFSPWLIFNLPNQFSGLDLYDQKLWDHFQLEYFLAPLSNFRKFVGYYLFGSFGPPFWAFSKFAIKSSALLYSAILFIPIVVALIIKRPKIRSYLDRPISFLFLYAVIFLTILQASDFYDPRYFMPLYPFIFLLSAYAMTNCDSFFRRFKVIAIPFLIIAFGFSNQFALSFESPGRILKTKGYAYQWIEQSVCRDYELCIRNYPSVMKKLSPDDLHEFSSELAAHSTLSMFKTKDMSEIIGFGKQTNLTFQKYFFYHLGREIVETLENLDAALSSIIKVEMDETTRDLITRGIYDNAAYSSEKISPVTLLASTPDSDKKLPSFWRYLGKQTGYFWLGQENDPFGIISNTGIFLTEVELKNHSDFLQGIGQYFYDVWASRPLNPRYEQTSLESLPKAYLDDILVGIGLEMSDRELYWQVADKNWYFETFTRKLNKSSKQKIKQGMRSSRRFLNTGVE